MTSTRQRQCRTERDLRRSVGAASLFAAAYGNLGSSIHHALGLVAAHALGLAPLVVPPAGGVLSRCARR